MVISPASISHVTDLNLYIVTNSRTSLELLFLLCFLFLFFFLFSFLLCSSFSVKQTIKFLFLLFPFSCLTSCICTFCLLLVFVLIFLFRLCANSDIFDFNFFEVWFFIFLTFIICFLCVNHAALACHF